MCGLIAGWLNPRQPVVPPRTYYKEKSGRISQIKQDSSESELRMRGETLKKHCVFEQAILNVHMGGLRGEWLAIFHSLSRSLKSYGRTWHSKQAE